MSDEIKINLRPFFQKMEPKVLKELQDSLKQSQQELTQNLKNDYKELTSLVAQITQTVGNNGSKIFAEEAHQNAYQRLANTAESLSAQFNVQRQQNQLDIKLNVLVQKLFVLEHKIMEHLAPSSATQEYEIFYNDPNNNNLLVFDKVITAKELYGKELIIMTAKGKLTNARLTLNQVINAQGQNRQLSQTDSDKILNLAYEAIANMVIWLQTLEDLKTKNHLGRQRWKRLMELRLLLGTTQLDTGHDFYNSFLKNAFNEIDETRIKQLIDYYTKNEQLGVEIHQRTLGKKNNRVYMRKKTYSVSPSQNRGHIYEAFVHMRENGLDSRSALEASIGNNIWWSRGDVITKDNKGIQVKTLLGGNNVVDVATLNSIFDLANYLLQLLQDANESSKKLDQYLSKEIHSDMNKIDTTDADAKASEYANEEKDKLIQLLKAK